MQLEFFPSRSLTLYLARLFITRIVAVLLMLVLVLQVLDLLGESGDILAYSGNGEAQLFYYVSLRIPQLIARFLPYSVLLATIITLATLNQNSEVISMKAAGLSAHQILAPLMLTALAVSVLSFGFNERVVTRASATLDAWQAVDYGPIPKKAGAKSNLYLADGRDLLLAQSLEGTGNGMVLHGVTFYRRDANGMIVEQLRAPDAAYLNPGWKLDKPVRFDVAGTKTTTLATATTSPTAGDRCGRLEARHHLLHQSVLLPCQLELKILPTPYVTGSNCLLPHIVFLHAVIVGNVEAWATRDSLLPNHLTALVLDGNVLVATEHHLHALVETHLLDR